MLNADAALDFLKFHRSLLTRTRGRLRAYRRAMQQLVKPGDTVLDLGTGSGILAFFACQAGARQVYAVDAAPILELARILLRENGIEDRVVLVEGIPEGVTLPRRVDAIVADMFGTSGLQRNALRSILDARDRLLRPGGLLLPRGMDLFAAPVELSRVYRDAIDGWNRASHGYRLSAVRSLAVNHRYQLRVGAGSLLGPGRPLAQVDFARAQEVMVRGDTELIARRRGVLHGICVWFESTLADGITVGNNPVATNTNYCQGFFPLERAVTLKAGDTVRFSLTAHDSVHWRWQVKVKGVATFDQATLHGWPAAQASLRAISPDTTPALSRRDQARRLLLNLTDGKTTLGELGRRLRDDFADLFPTEGDAATFAAETLSAGG